MMTAVAVELGRARGEARELSQPVQNLITAATALGGIAIFGLGFSAVVTVGILIVNVGAPSPWPEQGAGWALAVGAIAACASAIVVTAVAYIRLRSSRMAGSFSGWVADLAHLAVVQNLLVIRLAAWLIGARPPAK
jgi:hypothetical protein